MPTKHVKLSRPGSNPDRETDRKIAKAVDGLSEIERGKAALRAFREFAKSPASGLDIAYMSELMLLVKAWAVGGRRDFLDSIELLPDLDSIRSVVYAQEKELRHIVDDSQFLTEAATNTLNEALMSLQAAYRLIGEAENL